MENKKEIVEKKVAPPSFIKLGGETFFSKISFLFSISYSIDSLEEIFIRNNS